MKVRHILGISGGKDSAALAIYLKQKYPSLKIAYYEEIPFEVDGETGTYCRSRSGCYFCFFQQKIEWIWLYEQHPDLYAKAMEFEKDYKMAA